MSESIKVLMVGPDRGVHGGISALVNSYIEAGLSDKVSLKYIGTMKEGGKIKKLFVAFFAYVDFLLSVGNYDIVHVNFSSDSSFMRKSLFIRAAHRRGRKILLHQHGGDFVNYYENEISDKRRRYIRDVLDMGDVMLVLTESWREFFGRLTDKRKIRVMPNGIVTKGVMADKVAVTDKETVAGKESLDVDVNKNLSADKRGVVGENNMILSAEQNAVSGDMNKILFLGRICEAKGIRELLKAAGELHAENNKIHLYIGGIYEDENLRPEIEKCSDFATYIGWVSGKEKDRYLDECGVMAVPSYFEGFGLTVIEGMLHGCCVVASDVGGIPDIIENEKDGLMVPAKDAAALKNAIDRVMTDDNLAATLSENGRKKAVEKYSIERLSEELVGIYKELLS